MRPRRYFVQNIPRREFLGRTLGGGAALSAAPALLSQLLSCKRAQIDTTSTGPPAGTGSATPDERVLSMTIRKALAKGGEFAEVYVEDRISREIVMEESSFESAVVGISQGAGVRVISGDKTGYAYTDEVSEAKLMRAAEVASYIARGSEQTAPVDASQAERRSYVSVSVPLADVADERRLEVMERANQAALEYDARIKMTSISYYDETRRRTILNSEGLLLSDELPLLFFVVQALGIGDGTRHMSRERLSMHSGFEMFDKVPPEEVARRAAREAVAMLAAREAPAGTMDVVMHNGWGGVLVHEAIGHPLEADSIAKKVGIFTDKLGKKVAADIVTMVDDGTLPNHRGTTNFDDEGTQMKRNVLIRDGVLESYLTDILSAKQLGMQRTGNGRRQSFRHIPIPRMTNTFIDKGRDSPGDILASTKKGLYVQSLSGGSVNPITGVFNFTCREAYLIENGKKTMPVRGATLIGSCIDIVSNIDAVGDDLDHAPGICGKDGQRAEVDAGQPTVRIRGINVGGSKAKS
jgi:TldD protein